MKSENNGCNFNFRNETSLKRAGAPYLHFLPTEIKIIKGKKIRVMIDILTVMLIATLTVGLGGCLFDIKYNENYFEEGDYCYVEGIEVVGLHGVTKQGYEKSVLIIPTTMRGKPVALGDHGGGYNYWDTPNLKKIYIPYGVNARNSLIFEKNKDVTYIFNIGNVDLKNVEKNHNFYNIRNGKSKVIYPPLTAKKLEYYGLKTFEANVMYMMNYPEESEEKEYNEGYFWIDYLEVDEAIVNIPWNPECKGYKFIGWSKEKEGAIYDVNKIVGKADEVTILYAQWETK